MAKGKSDNQQEEIEVTGGQEVISSDVTDSKLNTQEALTDAERMAGGSSSGELAFDTEETEGDEDEEEREEKGERQRHAVVLTGGMDSTVMLYLLKEKLPNATFVPIIVGDKKHVNPMLNDLKVKSPTSKIVLPTDMLKAKDSDWDKFFKKLAESKISVIHFGANHEEGLNSIPDKNFPFYQRLNDIASRSKVQVSTPLSSTNKDVIIQMAVDKYDVDLGKLAPPIKVKKDDKTSEAYERIRQNGFKRIYSQRYARVIDDPYGPPRKAKVSEGG